MAKRSSVYGLPEPVRRAVEERLIANGFSGYAQLAQELREQGYNVSPAALTRYGQALQARYEHVMARVRFATELARAIAYSPEPDRNPLPDAVTAILQSYLFELLTELDSKDTDLATLTRAAQVLSALRRSDYVRARTENEIRAAAAAKLQMTDEEARRRGLDPETVRRLREEIYGLSDGSGSSASVPA
jgi:AcrR family transcriptional regulator